MVDLLRQFGGYAPSWFVEVYELTQNRNPYASTKQYKGMAEAPFNTVQLNLAIHHAADP